MVGAEASVDHGDLLGRRIVHLQLAPGTLHGSKLCRRKGGPRLAERRVVVGTDASGKPQAPALIEHGIVNRGVAVPDGLIAPHRRGIQRLRLARRIGIAILNLQLADRVVHRIEHRQIVAALLGRSVDQTVGVYLWIALVGGDLVVQISFRIGPVPLRDHHVALDALRPGRRLRRQLAVRDPGGPIAKQLRWLAGHRVETGRPSWPGRLVLTADGASRPAPDRDC